MCTQKDKTKHYMFFFFFLIFLIYLCRTLIMALTAVHKSTRVHNPVLTSCRQDSDSPPF